MHLDVLDLRSFYYRTRLGRVAQRAIRAKLAEFWPDLRGQNVAGVGFAVPLLRPALPQARRVIALMPADQGVMAWPETAANRAVLCEERRWPLPDGFIDRLILLHALETSHSAAAPPEEAARVLAPSGRALIVVPNRAGLWARRDATPFGYGRPYSLGQLEAQIARHGFQPERHRAALFSPPSERRFWLRMAPTLERAGQALSTYHAGGVLMLEASRRPWRPQGPGLEEMVRRPLRVLEGLSAPGTAPGGRPARDNAV